MSSKGGKGGKGKKKRHSKNTGAESERKVAKIPKVVDEKSDDTFSYFYSLYAQQQNMLQDSVRTTAYFNAFTQNPEVFKDKIVMDVGTGSSILAFFAVRAGAKKVYAIEASGMAQHARELVAKNGLSDKIEVIHSKVEDLKLPHKVDVIFSEPMGVILVHERMLESYVRARIAHLKPGGVMFPTTGTIFALPFTDSQLYEEQQAKGSFWANDNFYGYDLTSVQEQARAEHFSQPVVGPCHPKRILSSVPHSNTHEIDFQTESVEGLQNITMPLKFEMEQTAIVHGLVVWFDVLFDGENPLVLSTSCHSPHTHWHQCRLLLPEPMALNRGQVLSGTLKMKASTKVSYDLTLDLEIQDSKIRQTFEYHLQNQLYRYEYDDWNTAYLQQQEQSSAHTVSSPAYHQDSSQSSYQSSRRR